jgi:hypothetical protein
MIGHFCFNLHSSHWVRYQLDVSLSNDKVDV